MDQLGRDLRFQQAFGRRLRQVRAALGLTQRQFALSAGLSHTFLGQLERGHRGINISYLPSIAKAANITIADLIPDDNWMLRSTRVPNVVKRSLQAELCAVEGTQIVADEILLQDDATVLRGEIVPNEVTQRLLAAHEAAMTEWDAAREAGDHPPVPPQPAETILSQVRLGLEDAAGGSYRWTSAEFGGTGTELRAQWRFEPGLPRSITSVVIRATTPQGASSITIPAWPG